MTQAEALKARTRKFSLDVIRYVRGFPGTPDADIVGRQLVKAACSVAANYRAARDASWGDAWPPKDVGTAELDPTIG